MASRAFKKRLTHLWCLGLRPCIKDSLLLISEHEATFVFVNALASWDWCTLRNIIVRIVIDCLATQSRQVDCARVLRH